MAENRYTPEYDQLQIKQIEQQFNFQQCAFKASPYRHLQRRRADLLALKKVMLRHQDDLIDTLNDDFNPRSAQDSKMADIMPVLMTLNYTLKHLKQWMKPCRRHVHLLFKPATAKVIYQPLGVVGIIVPWTNPLLLSISPLITALAAGNRVMIKMSEFTPNTNALLKQMLGSIFSDDKVALICGGSTVAAHFATQPFAHLLFSGTNAHAKQVLSSAAQNLTPVTLALGGKTPTIIDNDIDIDDAVSSFMVAKTINAGQTCVAPDYILCPETRVDALQRTLSKHFNRLYPHIVENKNYSAMINQAQLQRLQAFTEDARQHGAHVVMLGHESLADCVAVGKFPLTTVEHTTEEMLLMKHEILGPLLPIIRYQKIESAIAYINAHPQPLALYLCTHNQALQQQVLAQTHSGGVSINDAAMHVLQDDLPFGGVGQSGMGEYHGYEGFLTFSKAKSLFKTGRMHHAGLAFSPKGKRLKKLIYALFIA